VEWIYFSPHLDDVALSCGGLVWEQCQVGNPVHIWTICAGDPPPGPLSPFAESLHDRWQLGIEAVEHRRLEDIASCAELGASYRHLPVPDCIYRRGDLSSEAVYTSEASLFGQVHPQEAALIDRLSGELLAILPDQATFVCPLALGGHVDHKLTRSVVEKLLDSKPDKASWDLWYYADYPYARDEIQALTNMERSLVWNLQSHSVTLDGLLAWERAVAAYTSQISTFWPHLEAMKADLRSFASQAGGIRLWQPNDLSRERTF
jgi:LmbE family N-acetylglucosaminyl deacetylase